MLYCQVNMYLLVLQINQLYSEHLVITDFVAQNTFNKWILFVLFSDIHISNLNEIIHLA